MDASAKPNEHPLRRSVAVQPIVTLAVVQFILYSAALSAATIGWLLVISGNQALLVELFGEYLSNHLTRWTDQMPLWGALCGIAGLSGLLAAWALSRARAAGVALGVVSYMVCFAVDLAVARTLFVHAAAGLLIGWMLLSPLVFGRRCFRGNRGRC